MANFLLLFAFFLLCFSSISRAEGQLIQIDGKDYGVYVLPKNEQGDALHLFNDNTIKTVSVKDCSLVVDMPAGVADGNHSYGGFCRLISKTKIKNIVRSEDIMICSDIMVSRLKMQNLKYLPPMADSDKKDNLVKFIVAHCYGG